MLSASTPVATAHMNPKHRKESSEPRLRCAAGQRSGRAERMLFGLALLSLAHVSTVWAGESARLPPGAETLIDRDAPALDAHIEARTFDARTSEARTSNSTAVTPSRATVHAIGSEHALGLFGRAPFRLPSVTDPAFGSGASGAQSSEAGLPDFALRDFSLEEVVPGEFRPRSSRSLLDAQHGTEDSLMNDSDTWQRLASEYRAHRRVRVVTLWDAGWSSVSLQAGKHGDPYLQWTGHLFGRSEANHGLLDHWMPSSAPNDGSASKGGIAHTLSLPSLTRSVAAAPARPLAAIP